MHLIAVLRARVRDEGGFTMVMVITVMFCVTMLAIAALSAAQGDLKPGSQDKERKVAYAAAEAGVQNYLFHLREDPDYWTKCTAVEDPHAVNDPWNGVSAADDNRRWMSIPDSGARYTIELLPANGAPSCSTAAPDATMFDADTGAFKIRVTGENTEGGLRRSIIATFKRQSLLDFLYLTDKETRAPELYSSQIPSRVSRLDTDHSVDLVGWAQQSCDRYHGTDPSLGRRQNQEFQGEYQRPTNGTWQHFFVGCVDPGLRGGEVMLGPMHTNDQLKLDCGNAVQLGGRSTDAVETSNLGSPASANPDPWDGLRGCTAPPLAKVNYSTTTTPGDGGIAKPRSAPVELPSTNAVLRDDTAAAYRFKGTTSIELSGTTMTVTGTRENGTSIVNLGMAIPSDGAVYVSNDGSCASYNAADSSAGAATCGNLELEGDYAVNVTFGAENDILLTGDVTRTSGASTALLGLIATGYVRVDHPVSNCNPATWPAGTPTTCNGPIGCDDAVDSDLSFTVHGAILSLTRSFIVDNWFCGSEQGTLHVTGAIAQKFFGPVGGVVTGGTGRGGYNRDYKYDPQFKYRSPPHFQDPVNAQWRVLTFSEQVPAR